MKNPRTIPGKFAAVCVVLAAAIAVSMASASDRQGEYSSEPIWVYDSDFMVGHVETADLNGDGTKDIIAGESNPDYYGYPQQVLAIDGKDGSLIWDYQLQDAVRSMTIGDLNDDGVMDVVAGASYNSSNTPDGYVHAINGVNGQPLWTYYIGNTISTVTVADLNGDAYLDVSAGSFDDFVYGIDGQTGGLLWSREIDALWINAVSAGDVNGDNIDDIGFAHEYLTNYSNHFGVIDGTDGSLVWDSIVPYIVMDVLIKDVDNDGTLEAVYGGIYGDDHGEIFVRNAADGALEWSYDLGSVDHSNGNILLGSYLLDDDSDEELIVATYLGTRQVFAFEGDVATPIWVSDVLTGHTRDFTVCDVTGDKDMNVVTAGTDRVEIINGLDGTLMWYYSVSGAMRSVSCADFDGDEIFDIGAGGSADATGTPPNPLKTVWALRTVQSPVLWEYDIVEYGNEIAMGDFDGDGCQDVVAVTSLGDNAIAISGVDGSHISTWVGTANLYAVTTGDFNNDGFDDAAVAGADQTVTAINYNERSVMWQFTTPTDQIYRKCLASADLNGDGYDDVVVGADDNMIYAIRGDAGVDFWSYNAGGEVNEIDLAQMNGTGPVDVVVAVGGGPTGERVLVIDGLDGSFIWAYTAPAVVEHVEPMDVNEDGFVDVAAGLAPYSRQVIMVNGATQTPIWSQPLDVESNIQRMGGGDVDGDKTPDVLVPTTAGVVALRGSDGNVLWTFPTGSEVNHTMAYDVDGDGFLEAVAGSDDQNVYVIDGVTGDEEWSYSVADDVMHIQIGDVDCDGKANITCVTFGSNGLVYAFATLDQTPDAVCGDSNGDEAVNISDAVYLINYIFKGGPAPDPLCSGDSNGDQGLNISDATYIIAYVFSGGPAPPDGCCTPVW